MGTSIAFQKFNTSMIQAEVLANFRGTANTFCADQDVVDQTCLRAAVANGVGCWEGYVEGVIREFVGKVRVQAHRKTWTLIAQYEVMVDKAAAELNTPSWEKARDLLLSIIGLDPYASWIWAPKFPNQTDTKNFLDGVMKVRHSFAHGFPVPVDVPGVAKPGALDSAYVRDALDCLSFFAQTTDSLLEHELQHRHGCNSGWV